MRNVSGVSTYITQNDHPYRRVPLGVSTDMRRLTTRMRSEKYVVRRFRRCANVRECIYTNLHSIAYYTPRLYGRAYCS